MIDKTVSLQQLHDNLKNAGQRSTHVVSQILVDKAHKIAETEQQNAVIKDGQLAGQFQVIPGEMRAEVQYKAPPKAKQQKVTVIRKGKRKTYVATPTGNLRRQYAAEQIIAPILNTTSTDVAKAGADVALGGDGNVG